MYWCFFLIIRVKFNTGRPLFVFRHMKNDKKRDRPEAVPVGLPSYPHGLKVRHHESQLLTKYVHENLRHKVMARFRD